MQKNSQQRKRSIYRLLQSCLFWSFDWRPVQSLFPFSFSWQYRVLQNPAKAINRVVVLFRLVFRRAFVVLSSFNRCNVLVIRCKINFVRSLRRCVFLSLVNPLFVEDMSRSARVISALFLYESSVVLRQWVVSSFSQSWIEYFFLKLTTDWFVSRLFRIFILNAVDTTWNSDDAKDDTTIGKTILVFCTNRRNLCLFVSLPVLQKDSEVCFRSYKFCCLSIKPRVRSLSSLRCDNESVFGFHSLSIKNNLRYEIDERPRQQKHHSKAVLVGRLWIRWMIVQHFDFFGSSEKEGRRIIVTANQSSSGWLWPPTVSSSDWIFFFVYQFFLLHTA